MNCVQMYTMFTATANWHTHNGGNGGKHTGGGDHNI